MSTSVYRLSDPRVASTRAALQRALLTACRATPYSEITVASLCRDAGVARKTFYAHFADVTALADEAVRDFMLPLVESIPDELLRLPLTSSGVAGHVLTGLAEQRERLAMLTRLPSEVLSRGFAPVMFLMFDRVVQVNRLKKPDPFVRDYWCSLVAGACEALFRTWVARGFRETPEQLALLAEQFLGTGLDTLLQQLIHPITVSPALPRRRVRRR